MTSRVGLLPCDRKNDRLDHTCKAGVLSLHPYPEPSQLHKDKQKQESAITSRCVDMQIGREVSAKLAYAKRSHVSMLSVDL